MLMLMVVVPSGLLSKGGLELVEQAIMTEPHAGQFSFLGMESLNSPRQLQTTPLEDDLPYKTTPSQRRVPTLRKLQDMASSSSAGDASAPDSSKQPVAVVCVGMAGKATSTSVQR